jgi:hypothetical protein
MTVDPDVLRQCSWMRWATIHARLLDGAVSPPRNNPLGLHARIEEWESRVICELRPRVLLNRYVEIPMWWDELAYALGY